MPRRFSLPGWLRPSRRGSQDEAYRSGDGDCHSSNRFFFISTGAASRAGQSKTQRRKSMPLEDRFEIVHNFRPAFGMHDPTSGTADLRSQTVSEASELGTPTSNQSPRVSQSETASISTQSTTNTLNSQQKQSGIPISHTRVTSSHGHAPQNGSEILKKLGMPVLEVEGLSERDPREDSENYDSYEEEPIPNMWKQKEPMNVEYLDDHPPLQADSGRDRVGEPQQTAYVPDYDPGDLDSCTWLSVYDGSGILASDYAARTMGSRAGSAIISSTGNIPEALTEAFTRTDMEFRKMPGSYESRSWTCALVVLIVGDVLFVANAGNSKAIHVIPSENPETNELNRPHTADSFTEKHRIIQAGGRVLSGIVNGHSRASRGIGCHGDRGIVAKPDVMSYKLNPTATNVILLATEGLWDFSGSTRVTRYVSQQLVANPDTSCSTLATGILEIVQSGSGFHSDMSVVVAILRPRKTEADSVGIDLGKMAVTERRSNATIEESLRERSKTA